MHIVRVPVQLDTVRCPEKSGGAYSYQVAIIGLNCGACKVFGGVFVYISILIFSFCVGANKNGGTGFNIDS